MTPPAALPVAQWQLHNAFAHDDARLLPLFAEVFGHTLSAQEWAWKYTGSPLRGSVLNNVDIPVAFFGGMARPFVYQGQRYLAVQNGDVMVHPSQRGVFSRRGALYQVASNFFSQHVGPGQRYAFAFGFPNARHMRLGLKLGIYQQAGQLQSLRWPTTLPPGRKVHPGWYWQPLPHDDLGWVERLWARMQSSWSGHFLPVRDSARWAYRYLQRPGVPYTLLVVRQRFTGRPLAALALRQHPDHVHWLDYVGAARYVSCAVTAARAWAGARGLPLHALVSDTVVASFAVQQASVTASEITIPANASAAPDQPWLGRLWLMGGDSDFM